MKNEVKKKKQTLSGKVVKISSEKTIDVEVVSYRMHPKYQKKFKDTKRYLVHDEKNRSVLGENIVFSLCSPKSKRKCFEVIES